MDSDTLAQPPAPRPTRRRSSFAPKDASVVDVLNPLTLQPLPRWITSAWASENIARQGAWSPIIGTAFAAGAAIFALIQIIRAEPPWLGCWRMRLALKAAAAASKLLRLNADEAGLRDSEHLTRPGDDPGPAGRLLRLLRQLGLRPTRLADDTMRAIAAEIEGAAAGAEVLALLHADIDLAERLGWERPLLLHLTAILDPAIKQGAAGKRPRADQLEWVDLQQVVLARAAVLAHAEAVVLARKAESLAVAAAQLRTRDDGQGLALIFTDDSVAPWRMVARGSDKGGLGSDRAARRFCESLHQKGALRLLTDRPTFRLYGL